MRKHTFDFIDPGPSQRPAWCCYCAQWYPEKENGACPAPDGAPRRSLPVETKIEPEPPGKTDAENVEYIEAIIRDQMPKISGGTGLVLWGSESDGPAPRVEVLPAGAHGKDSLPIEFTHARDEVPAGLPAPVREQIYWMRNKSLPLVRAASLALERGGSERSLSESIRSLDIFLLDLNDDPDKALHEADKRGIDPTGGRIVAHLEELGVDVLRALEPYREARRERERVESEEACFTREAAESGSKRALCMMFMRRRSSRGERAESRRSEARAVIRECSVYLGEDRLTEMPSDSTSKQVVGRLWNDIQVNSTG